VKSRDIPSRFCSSFKAMPQSLAQIYVHLVFSTKDRMSFISPEVQGAMYAYLAGTLNAIDCPALKVGGMPDHVHILFRLSKNMAVTDVVKAAKVESSKWMKERGGVKEFAWQSGYGAFSIGASQVETVREYISSQDEHHRHRTFQEEFRKLLERYQISYDEAWVWG
jgi:REP element-mobilizing transposase RayT